MLNLTDEQKRLFYTGGNYKNYVFDFPEIGLKITNDIIHQEAVTIKQSICDEQELKLGGCLASSIEFEVSEIMQHDLTGLEFSTTLYVNLKENGTYDLKIPMGVYRVDSCKLMDDKDYKKVIAYDALYDASVDVSDWYREILPSDDSTIKIKAMRESLLEHLGMSYVKQTLANDDIFIEKTIEPSDGSMTGTSVLKLICELNGGFGKINQEGLFEVVNVHGLGLFPEEDLYPEETLYPEDHFLYMGISDDNSYPEYRETKYEEYMCPAPTCVTIKSTDDDYGTTAGEDLRNPYLISGNYLLYGKKFDDLKQIARNILKKIDSITYRPNSTKLWGLPYMETGDVFALKKRRDDIESYIFTRTLTGVQGLWDTYEAKGSEIRDNKVSANDEIIQLKGKTLVIKKSIDGVSYELSDLKTKTNTRFEQTNNSIVLKVDSQGNIAEVALGVDANDPSATKFTVTAKNIELSAEEVINLMAGGTLNLTGKKIKIESDNFSVDKDGKVAAKSIDITGGTINIEADINSENKIEMKYIGNDGFTSDKTTMDSDGISYEIHSGSSGEDYVSRIAMEKKSGSFNTQLSIKNYMGEESSLYLSQETNPDGSYIWIDSKTNEELDIKIETQGKPSLTYPETGNYENGDLALDIKTNKVYILDKRFPLSPEWNEYTIAIKIFNTVPVWTTEDYIKSNGFFGNIFGNVTGNLSGKAFMAECDQNGLNIAENYLKDNISFNEYSLSGDIISMNNIGSLNPWQGLQGGYPTIGSGLYIVFGQVTFESVPESGTRACRILFDGQEQGVTQVISAYLCVLQCMAMFYSETTSTIMFQCLQNSGSTLNCDGKLSVLKIK